MIVDSVTRRCHSIFGRSWSAVLCALLLSSCSSTKLPEYQQPELAVKSSWSRPTAVSPSETIRPDWWREFGDPYLDDLVTRAIGENFDLKVLAARTRVAEAQIAEARAGALPTIDVGAGSSVERTTGGKSTTIYNVGTQLNWEIDVWGKVARGVQAQTAEFRATEADWRAAYLTLVSDVSTTYFQILQFHEQIERQQAALERNKQILTIYEAMLSNGLIPQTQVRRQRAEINRLTNELLELRRFRDLAENALATLMGVSAGEVRVPPGRLQDRVRIPQVPAGLPAQLLARRPDILAAEYRVLGAHNQVGQARLAQLPSISLTARGGSASFALSDLLKSFTLGLMPSINIPVFDPSIKARVKTTEANNQVAEQDYRRTIIVALEEVENALVNLDVHQKQRIELEQQTEHLRVVGEQIEAQLKVGLVSQLEVFETERSLLSAQLALLASHQQILSDTVTLYKALGGGWPDVSLPSESGR